MYQKFDRSLLKLKPLGERIHDLDMSIMLYPGDKLPGFRHPSIDAIARRIEAARGKSAVIFMMGAHVIRSGVSPLIIDMMERGMISHIALNGAGSIHDFEFALIGGTSESVAKYISEGQFGLWEETGRINDAVVAGVRDGLGYGEAVGRAIEEGDFPYKRSSLLAAAYRLRIPATVHVGVGNDIIHQHPNCDGAALGRASYEDFLIYANTISQLEGGVFLNFGSAVTGPEVYLKCLAMARNVAHQRGERIARFTTAVFDLLPLEDKNVRETPPKDDPRYYFRPWKTILARTVADGGESYYIQGMHRDTVSALYTALNGQ